MSEQKPFDKSAARNRTDFRREKVTLDCGDVWVREMTLQESRTLAERASRPAIDPRGGLDPQESVLWQIILSCFVSDSPDAERVFSESPDDIHIILNLRVQEFGRLMLAIGRVNGTDPEEMTLLRDFIKVSEAEQTSR